MKLYSTNNRNQRVAFETAVFNSMPADKGLYMPHVIPKIDATFLANIDQYSLQQVAFEVASCLLQDAIPSEDLRSLVNDAVNFDAPAVKLDDETYVLELFHGPSLAFKDFGARFMSRIMSYFLKESEQTLDVLVATSGDTGGAVALGFLGVPDTRVTILYPRGKVSEIQELQLCTNGSNIRTIEVAGTFDDCQRMVKNAFGDEELSQKLRLTSANSINIARLIPQTFYYFYTYAQLKRQGKTNLIFSVPSGNFGNIAAGLLAYRMGLPVRRFIAATNINDTVPRYLETGRYQTKPSLQTFANAMDVGAPSNWVRIMDLFDNDISSIRDLISSYWFTDEQTLCAIETLHEKYNYIACPHTAIAWLGIHEYRKSTNGQGDAAVFLSTAHACKFPDVFPDIIKNQINIPEQVALLRSRPKHAIQMDSDFESLKAYLLSMESHDGNIAGHEVQGRI